MTDEEEYYDDIEHGRADVYRPHTDIDPNELTSALHSLHLLRADMYLTLQVTNLTVIDQFIMDLEFETLQELLRTERTPPQAMFLNAQSQMWIFAVYELLRTWRSRAKEAIKLAENGGLNLRAASLDEDGGFVHSARKMRAKQLRNIAENPATIEIIKTDLRRAHIPFARIEHLRVSLAKHEVRGKQGSVAFAPGYGRINNWSGSLDYQLENGPVILDTISRRGIADEIRALNDPTNIPTEESIASFDLFMKASISKEELETLREE